MSGEDPDNIYDIDIEGMPTDPSKRAFVKGSLEIEKAPNLYGFLLLAMGPTGVFIMPQKRANMPHNVYISMLQQFQLAFEDFMAQEEEKEGATRWYLLEEEEK